MENKNYIWRPVSEYTGGRVLATNGLDVLIGEINSEGDCESEEGGSTILCGITGFIKIEEMFPELKESEKRMIQYFKDLAPFDKADELYEKYGFSHKAAIAWLEKRGQTFTKKDVDDAYLKGICDAKHELEKQNHAWNEEDEKMLSDIVDCIKELPIFYESVNINGEDKIAERFICDAINWLKSIKDRVLLLPKQEWSEEDEKMWLSAIEYVRTHPAQTRSVVEWLKSLKERYTWKPNEEQMDALLYILRYYTPAATDKLAWDSLQTLELMLEQLKKLK